MIIVSIIFLKYLSLTSQLMIAIFGVKEAKGRFTIKSAYRTSQKDKWAGPVSAIWKRIWGVRMSERLRMPVWRVAVDLPPTRCRLAKLFGIEDQSCFRCYGGRELAFY